MHISRRTLILSIVVAVAILCGCAAVFFLSTQIVSRTGGAKPPELTEQPSSIQATELSPSDSPTVSPPEITALPALPERRRLTLEFPPRMRTGDSDLVRLILEVDDLGNLTPTAEIEGNVITGKIVEIPNLYETHLVIAEARFDIAGMEVRPAELVSEALSPGNSVTFRWSIHPSDVGVYQGTVWLYLRFVDKANGNESRKAISAQTVEIQAGNFFGLPLNVARATGVVGSVVGTVIGFPFLEDILKLIFKKRKPPK